MVETRSISAGVPPRGSLATTPRSNGSAKSTNGSVHKLSGAVFTHTPTALTLIWLAVSLPLVAWDTGYVLLRPYSMPGGSLHWPLWVPYELYGRVDHVYGWPAWNSRSGFTGAQSIMNVVETVLYVVYLGLYFAQGQGQTIKTVKGRVAAVATLVLFSSSVMTLSKTVLYGLNEACSGFANVGQNSPVDLVLLWIIPNGCWIVLPAYMTYVYGGQILDSLAPPAKKSE